MAIGWLLLLATDVIVLLGGFPALYTRIRSCGVRRSFLAPSGLTADQVLEAFSRANVLGVHRYRCLKYSAAATWLLRLHGHPASFVMAIANRPFRSHAWLEYAGGTVGMAQDDGTQWNILLRI